MLGFSQLGSLALGQLPIQPSIGFISSWSEPSRARKTTVRTEQFGPVLDPNTQIVKFFESRWHYPWSEPVRLKPGLKVHLQSFSALQILLPPGAATILEGWYSWFSEPVRCKLGLAPTLQQYLAHPPRLLPTPNVTLVMRAVETNPDIAMFGVVIYNKASAAIVSVLEIPATNSGAASIEEV
jgi:hypothetical protein